MNNFNYKNLTPFKWFVLENFPFIENNFEAIDNYRLFSKVVEYLNKTIDNVNVLGNLVEQFSNYFDNLNVQEEINNKLDEMTINGTLSNIIGNYINPYLDKFNSRINIQDEYIRNIDAKVDSVASGSPAGVYATVEALTTADPDHTKIYLVTTDGNWYYYANNQWNAGGLYQAAVTNQGDILYTLESLSSIDVTQTNDYSINFFETTDVKHIIRVKNNSGNDGFITIEMYQGERRVLSNSALYTSGETKEIELNNIGYYTKIHVININDVSSVLLEILTKREYLYNVSIEDTNKIYEYLFGKKANIINGMYINAEGGYGEASSYKILEIKVKPNEKFFIKANSAVTSFAIYNEDEEPIYLNSGSYKGYYTIPANGKILRISGDGEIEYKYITDFLKIYNNANKINTDCLLLNDYADISNTNITTSAPTNNGITMSLTNTSNIGVLQYKYNNIYKNILEKLFLRLRIKANANSSLHIEFMTENNHRIGYDIILKTNQYYDIYMCNNVVTGDYIYNEITLNNGNVTIIDSIIGDNDKLYYNEETLDTMKKFETNTIVIDSNGYGHFKNFPEALTFCKEFFDVNNEDVLLYVKNGIYEVQPTNIYPYSPINKGANRISIIGEDMNNTIINCYNTSTTQSKVMEIGGPCIIKNLTVNSLNDGTFNSENDLHHNCYCIHNDAMYNTENKYVTAIEDCKLYSECSAPLGGGLHDKQTQRYKNVDFISNGFISIGALYLHSSVESYADDMAVEIINCSCVSKDNTKAITMPDVDSSYQSLPYTDIPVTIQRTIAVTNGVDVTDANFKNTHKLTESSALNNINDFNSI